MNALTTINKCRFGVVIGVLVLFLFGTVQLYAKSTTLLTYYQYLRHYFLYKVPESSDVIYDSTDNSLYIVSDQGGLYQCDTAGKVLRKAPQGGLDYEGIEIKDSFIYVSDETARRVMKYNKSDLALIRSYNVAWGGGINKAYESIVFNPAKNCFILISEQPADIVECDTNFNQIAKYSFKAKDISGARFYKDKLYLLSDLEATVFICNPRTYQKLESYKVKVNNPEGIAFNNHNETLIVSDNMQTLFYFKSIY
ncbi:MAG: hypothetical protein EBX41_09365 [Chitinophagia bacterium]|nr:hypothetical protein [Chitinophagia bacterium]